jgi:hypothetical protein
VNTGLYNAVFSGLSARACSGSFKTPQVSELDGAAILGESAVWSSKQAVGALGTLK